MAATTKFDKQTSRFTPLQLAELARTAGIKDGGAVGLAVAIALAESGGDPKERPKNKNGTYDEGLWQINTVHKKSGMLIPSKNADAMAQISKGGKDWSPWVAYTTGRHKQHLKAGSNAAMKTADIKGSLGSSIDSALGTGVDTGVNIGDVFGLGNLRELFDVLYSILTAFTDRGFWIRAGKIMLGFVLLLMGISKLGKAIGTGRVARDAKSAAKGAKGAAGGAAKVAKKIPNPATKVAGTVVDKAA